VKRRAYPHAFAASARTADEAPADTTESSLGLAAARSGWLAKCQASGVATRRSPATAAVASAIRRRAGSDLGLRKAAARPRKGMGATSQADRYPYWAVPRRAPAAAERTRADVRLLVLAPRSARNAARTSRAALKLACQPHREVERSHDEEERRNAATSRASRRGRRTSQARRTPPARRKTAGTVERRRNDAIPPPAARSRAAVNAR
jgi:hypothetical protein